MSKDEVLKALKEMKEINGPDIIDITPTEDEDGSGFLSTDADGNEKDTA